MTVDFCTVLSGRVEIFWEGVDMKNFYLFSFLFLFSFFQLVAMEDTNKNGSLPLVKLGLKVQGSDCLPLKNFPPEGLLVADSIGKISGSLGHFNSESYEETVICPVLLKDMVAALAKRVGKTKNQESFLGAQKKLAEFKRQLDGNQKKIFAAEKRTLSQVAGGLIEQAKEEHSRGGCGVLEYQESLAEIIEKKYDLYRIWKSKNPQKVLSPAEFFGQMFWFCVGCKKSCLQLFNIIWSGCKLREDLGKAVNDFEQKLCEKAGGEKIDLLFEDKKPLSYYK